MSHGAKWLYAMLLTRYNVKAGNNGRVYLAQRKATQMMRSGRKQISRWYRELAHYGFIIQTSGGALGLDGKGRSPHWRLTQFPAVQDVALPDGTARRMPVQATKEFLLWDGTVFRNENRILGAKSPPGWSRKRPHLGNGIAPQKPKVE
jgi:hypothetical protein